MNEEQRPWRLQRILVALDASPHSLAALEAAIQMAIQSGAEITGLFVEDINLSHLAAMPFATEICLISATDRQFDTQCIERHLHAQATRIRHTLEGQAERASVRWSFHVARGRVAQEVLLAAEDADVVVLGRAGSSLVHHRHLGSTARAVLSGAPRATLVIQQGMRVQPPILVVYDGSPLAAYALAAAAALAGEEHAQLTILVPTGDEGKAAEIKGTAREWLQAQEIRAEFRLLTNGTLPALVHALRRQGRGTLVIPGKLAMLEDEALFDLLEQIEIPVLIVR